MSSKITLTSGERILGEVDFGSRQKNISGYLVELINTRIEAHSGPNGEPNTNQGNLELVNALKSLRDAFTKASQIEE